MTNYEQLLESAYSNMKTTTGGSERFEIPRVKGQVSGKNTILTNLKEIADYLRRSLEHLAKYLQKELATPGKIENDRLILKARLSSAKVNEKITHYVQAFVLCNECKKPDTEIISEKGIKFKHCLACGAKSPIKERV